MFSKYDICTSTVILLTFLKENLKWRQTQACYIRFTVCTCYSGYSHIQYLYIALLNSSSSSDFSSASRALVKIFCLCLQASEHLRKLCMQNMVWSYCKKISPEWKHQVSVVPSPLQTHSFVIFLFVCVTVIKSVWVDGAEDDRQWDLQGQEGQLPAERAQTVCQHKTQWDIFSYYSKYVVELVQASYWTLC